MMSDMRLALAGGVLKKTDNMSNHSVPQKYNEASDNRVAADPRNRNAYCRNRFMGNSFSSNKLLK